MTPPAARLPDPGLMSDAALLAEADRLTECGVRDAAVDPATLCQATVAGYRMRPHLRVIGDAMARLDHPDPGRRLRRIMIRVPPQTGKTVTAVVGGASWWLARHRTDRVIIGSYNSQLATDRGRDVRKWVAGSGARFDLHLERGSTSMSDWRLTSGGGVKSVGVGTGVAGSPGNFVIIDDPHKSREEAASTRMRDRVWNWWSADILSRLSPDAPIVLVMTPWDPDDLTGRLLKYQGRDVDGGLWHVVDMPVICTHPDTDPLGRPAGAPLTHPHIPTRDLAAAARHWRGRRAESTPQDWASLYMLDPKPLAGALVSRDLLRQRRHFGAMPPARRTAVGVDPSGGGKDTAGIVAGSLAVDGRLYLTHDWTDVMDPNQWAAAACELAVEADADTIFVEVNYGGAMATTMIRNAWASLRREEIKQLGGASSDRYREHALYSRLCPHVRAVRAKKSKLLRADPVAQQWRLDNIRTGAYLPELEDEWSTWQPSNPESPGRVDASVYLAYGLLPVPAAGVSGASTAPSGTMPSTTASPLGTSSGAAGGSGFSAVFGPLG